MTLSDWIALAALGLGIGNATALWWSTRAATLSVAYEMLQFTTLATGNPMTETRIVLTNHGRAKARHVEVTLFNDSGEDITEGVAAGWPPQPMSVLQPGQRLHLLIGAGMGGFSPTRAVVKWRDHRPWSHRLDYLLGIQRLI